MPTLALKPRGDVTEVQSTDISGHTKKTYVLKKFNERCFLLKNNVLFLQLKISRSGESLWWLVNLVSRNSSRAKLSPHG